ncbi:MAG: hypothetical protein AAFY34_14815 [Pseudomonadota bacterium]
MTSQSFTKRSAGLATLLLAAVWFIGGAAHATRLEVPDDAPLIAHVGAGLLLYLHIGGGTIGLLSGVVAIGSRKGARVHRAAGKVFLVSMFVTYLIGAGVAPFLVDGQRPNFIAGIMALYLLITAWLTVRRPGPVDARTEHVVGLVFAVAIAGLGFVFMRMGAASPTGTIDGSPPQAFVLFMVVGAFAAAGELHVILRRTLSGAARIARHLWRMCVSMFIASGSLFLGQPQVFPEDFNASPWPFICAFAPLMAMLIWLVLVRRPARPSRARMQTP